MWRVSARRAASIWRAVTRSGSIAFRPYWPKAKSLALVAMPLIRPLCALRNLVFDGCSIATSLVVLFPRAALSGLAPRPAGLGLGETLILRHRVVLHDLA